MAELRLDKATSGNPREVPEMGQFGCDHLMTCPGESLGVNFTSSCAALHAQEIASATPTLHNLGPLSV